MVVRLTSVIDWLESDEGYQWTRDNFTPIFMLVSIKQAPDDDDGDWVTDFLWLSDPIAFEEMAEEIAGVTDAISQ